jgi:hypothetical protein
MHTQHHGGIAWIFGIAQTLRTCRSLVDVVDTNTVPHLVILRFVWPPGQVRKTIVRGSEQFHSLTLENRNSEERYEMASG